MSLGYTWDVMYAANRLACKHHPTIGENIGSAAQPQLLLKVPAVLPATKSKPDLPNSSIGNGYPSPNRRKKERKQYTYISTHTHTYLCIIYIYYIFIGCYYYCYDYCHYCYCFHYFSLCIYIYNII